MTPFVAAALAIVVISALVGGAFRVIRAVMKIDQKDGEKFEPPQRRGSIVFYRTITEVERLVTVPRTFFCLGPAPILGRRAHNPIANVWRITQAAYVCKAGTQTFEGNGGFGWKVDVRHTSHSIGPAYDRTPGCPAYYREGADRENFYLGQKPTIRTEHFERSAHGLASFALHRNAVDLE